MSGFIEGEDRTQANLFPERIEEFTSRLRIQARIMALRTMV